MLKALNASPTSFVISITPSFWITKSFQHFSPFLNLFCFIISIVAPIFPSFFLLAFNLYFQWFHMVLKALKNHNFLFMFTQGVVDRLHLFGILNFRVVDYGFFGVITLWYFQLFFCANCICFFIQHFNSSKFGVWCFLSMTCTWSVKI